MTGIALSVCPVCAWRGFPQRLWCPRCGSFELGEELADRGVVEETTTLERAAGRPDLPAGTRLGTVRVEGDVAVVARLESAAPGDAVRLAVVAGAVIATCNMQ
jgi:uncharacterized OB-fold protein